MTLPAHPSAGAACPVCGGAEVAALHTASERMYGMDGSFTYRECAPCGSLAITEVPEDLPRYYPDGYYSFAMPEHSGGDRRMAQLARQWSTRAALATPATAAAAVAGGRRLRREVPAWVALLAGLRLSFDAAVLDVGCGDGHRLRTLRRHGFRNLVGVDPHLPAPTNDDGVRLLPAAMEEMKGPFDLVMFHHSFEHAPDPMAVLAGVDHLLAAEGALVLRVPLAGSWAWRAYGAHWVQLDAPRHLFLPSTGGLHLLAARARFRVARTIYDSDGFQFWGSEQYLHDVPLYPNGPGTAPTPMFEDAQLQDFDRRADDLNARGDGDQAAFLLRKAV